MEKEYNEDLYWVQLIEEQSQLSSSHTKVPYDLDQLGTYIENYNLIRLVEQCDGVVDVPHQKNVYISPIQSWIEESRGKTCQFGKQFDDLITMSMLTIPHLACPFWISTQVCIS